MVPAVRLELTLCCQNWILSPARLPIPPRRHRKAADHTGSRLAVNCLPPRIGAANKQAMLRRMYDWTMTLAGRPNALPALGVVSFVESSFFPIPPDVMLLPMVLARPERAWTIALVCTVTSVAGGVLGYAIGYYLFETIGMAVIKFYGYEAGFETFRQAYAEWGLWIILIKGMTPIPYKLVTITSGFAGYSLFWFVVLSIVTRGARFFFIALLMTRYGPTIKGFIDRHFNAVAAGGVAAIIGGFVAFRYLF